MESTFNSLSEKYGLPVDFLKELHDKIVDKENFTRAVRMFVDGLMPYDTATGKDPINVAELRHQVAAQLRAFRADKERKMQEALEQHRRIVEYYDGCKRVKHPKKANASVCDVAFIKDGHLVAFGHFEPRQGGIYAANNEVMPNFRWNPREILADIRKKNKPFYREIKKAAVKSPREWFDFNDKTITK